MADYLSKAGDPAGCYGNRVYANRIFITAGDYPQYDRYTPMAWAIYYSASAGDNFVFGNDITVEKTHPLSKTQTAAFYVCGGPAGYGGRFYNNRVAANVPFAWVASMYGGAARTKMYDNTIVRLPGTQNDFKPIRIGYAGCGSCVARDVEFRSNVIEGNDFDVQVSEGDHTFSVYWTLDVAVKDKKGKPVTNAIVDILDANGKKVESVKTDDRGKFSRELMEYSYRNNRKEMMSPYTLVVSKQKTVVPLKANGSVTVQMQ
jgi:hypothetical protein